jgi:tryptophan synthase alpha chain
MSAAAPLTRSWPLLSSGVIPQAAPSPAAGRFDTALRSAAARGRPLLAGCLPAGWPSGRRGRGAAWEALAGSSDLVEVALPSRWPYLDGETMRRAYAQALDGGYRHDLAIGLAGDLAAAGKPVIVMAYWHTIGGDAGLARDFAAAGAAGLVIPDLPASCAPSWSEAARGAGLHTILLSGSTDPADLGFTARVSSGAVYVPAAGGPTGGPSSLREDLGGTVGAVSRLTGLPVMTGIGITGPGRAGLAARARPAVIIAGSAFVRAAAGAGNPGAAIRVLAGQFTNAISGATSRMPAARHAPVPGPGLSPAAAQDRRAAVSPARRAAGLTGTAAGLRRTAGGSGHRRPGQVTRPR